MSKKSEVIAPVAPVTPVVEFSHENFLKLRSALIAEIAIRKVSVGTLTAQQNAITVLTKAVGELRLQLGALSVKLTEQQGETRRDKFIAARNELLAERGLAPGTVLPEAHILQRLREREALAEQKTPMAVQPAQAEEVLDF